MIYRREVLLGLPALVAARAVYALAVTPRSYPAGTIYVSKSATNGFAAGNDDHTLAQATAANRQTPFLTIAKAVASRAGGERIVVNSGIYAGAELGDRKYMRVGQASLSIEAFEPGQVVLQGSATVAVVRLDGISDGATVTLDGLVLDGAGISDACIRDDVTDAPFHRLIVKDCHMLGATRWAIATSCTGIDLKLDGNVCEGVPSLLRVTRLATPSRVVITGGSTTAPASEPGRGTIEVRAVEPGVAFSCSQHKLSVTLDESLSGRGNHHGILAASVESVSITGNDIAMSGTPEGRLPCPIRVYADAALPVTAPVVSDNVVTNRGRGGFGITIGNDAPGIGDGWVTDPVVTNNQVIGVAANQTSALHGIILGRTQGGQVLRNSVSDCALALIEKLNTVRGALFAANTVRLTACPGVGYSIALYAKGSLGTRFINNSVYIDDQSTNRVYVAHVRTDQGDARTRNARYANNATYFTGSADVRFVNVESENAASFARNLYYAAGSMPGDYFRYQGAGYASVAQWVAIEPDALDADPGFAAPEQGDFTLRTGSASIGAGVATGEVAVDKAGKVYSAPPSIGAYEYARG